MSNRADTKMVQALKVKNTQAKYNCGNKVIIRRFSSSSRRKSAKEKQKRFVVGEIIHTVARMVITRSSTCLMTKSTRSGSR